MKPSSDRAASSSVPFSASGESAGKAATSWSCSSSFRAMAPERTGGRRTAASSLPSSNAVSICGVSISPWTVMRSPGRVRRAAWTMMGISRYVAVPVNPTRSTPVAPSPTCCTSDSRTCSSWSSTRPRSSRTWPAGVSSTFRVVRTISGVPSCSSSCRICWDKGGCAIWSLAAALPKCRSSATAMKYLRCRVSIEASQ